MDIKIPLACILILGGALGIALPAFSGPDRLEQDYDTPPPGITLSDSQASSTALNIARTEDDQPAEWAEQVTLHRERDGHFYADVTVDGQPLNMLVDTGASVVALTGADASAMGLFWDEADIAPVAKGASGEVHGVNVVLPRMSVGGFEAKNVPALIVPDGLEISLLGQSFLSSVNKVQIEDNRMVLSN